MYWHLPVSCIFSKHDDNMITMVVLMRGAMCTIVSAMYLLLRSTRRAVNIPDQQARLEFFLKKEHHATMSEKESKFTDTMHADA